MAGLPGRRPEEPLRLAPAPAAVLAALVATLAAPDPSLRAQDGQPAGPRLLAVAGGRMTSLAGDTRLLGGGALLVRVGRVRVGGGGWAAGSRVALDAAGELSFGYGGVVAEGTALEDGRLALGGRLLLGAGSADVSNPSVGVSVDTDNVGVVEPELLARALPLPRVEAALSAGWRFVVGVDDQPFFAASDLGGWTAAITVALDLF